MNPPTFAEQAAALRIKAEKAFRRGDGHVDRGNDLAAVRAWQEGRRLAARAAQYEALG